MNSKYFHLPRQNASEPYEHLCKWRGHKLVKECVKKCLLIAIPMVMSFGSSHIYLEKKSLSYSLLWCLEDLQH